MPETSLFLLFSSIAECWDLVKGLEFGETYALPHSFDRGKGFFVDVLEHGNVQKMG